MGGLISTDTTWTVAGSPYILTGDVTVAANVTLTIAPGVMVEGSGIYALHVLGNLRAIGEPANPLRLHNLDMGGSNRHNDPPYQIEIQHVHVEGGRINPAGMAGYGSLILRDSFIAETRSNHPVPDNNSIDLWYPVADS